MNQIKTNFAKENTFFLLFAALNLFLPLIFLLTFPLWILPYFYIYCFKKAKALLGWGLGVKKRIEKSIGEEQMEYAVLKGNGRYLRLDDARVLEYQFYDYTIRRFMSVSHLQSQAKIIQIQPECPSALLFIINRHQIKQLYTIKTLPYQSPNPRIIPLKTYQVDSPRINFDCLVLFQIKRKIRQNSQLDLLQILSFCNYHMEVSGYMVFGDYFEQGQLDTFIKLFKLYHFQVVDEEDITKNIHYAKRLRRVKKAGENSVLQWMKRVYKEWFMFQQGNKKFKVIILESDCCGHIKDI